MKKLLNFIKSRITKRIIISMFVCIITGFMIRYAFILLFELNLTAHPMSVECASFLVFMAAFKFIVNAILDY
jgi:hypothetical protein